MHARLLSLDGGADVELEKELSLVGRDEECDVRLDHKSVSKQHCVLVKTDGLVLVRDLGSTNGTRVNGQRIRRAALMPNDTLSVANLKFTVTFGPELETTLEVPPEEAKRGGAPIAPLRRNAHPDVYPESKPRT